MTLDAQHPNIRAFARVLWESEGVFNATSPGIMYRTIYGGTILPNDPQTWLRHPRQKVTKWGHTSDAAGAYQFLGSTWTDMQAFISLPDFKPPTQDKAFAFKLTQIPWGAKKKVYDYLIAGDISGAISAAKSEWASLPGGSQSAKSKTLAQLTTIYKSAGGQIA